MELKDLFEKFMREQEYVKNLAPNTLKSYRNAFVAWNRFKGSLTEDGLIDLYVPSVVHPQYFGHVPGLVDRV